MSRLRQGLVLSWLSLTLASLNGCNDAPNPPEPSATTSSVDANVSPASGTVDSTNAVVSTDNSAEAETSRSVLLTSNDQPSTTANKSAGDEPPLFKGWNKPTFALVFFDSTHHRY